MKKLQSIILAATVAASLTTNVQAAGHRVAEHGFASDLQNVPVMGNTPGANNSRFQTSVAIFNPTDESFSVSVTLHDASGVDHNAMITLAAHEQKSYANFLEEVFAFTGGGGVTFQSVDTAGTHNHRFILDVEVYTTGTKYGTTIPAVEFPSTGSPSFSPGITVDANSRSNVGCSNTSNVANPVHVTVFDRLGTAIGTAELNLPANGWGQANITTTVSNGYIRFEPSDAALCYASVVNNTTNDSRFVPATEYLP
jgi:hypothetical protein